MSGTHHLNLEFWLGGVNQANKFELIYPIFGAFVILSIRYTVMRFVLRPIGIWFGLRDFKSKKPSPDDFLEAKYRKSKRWNSQLVLGLSKQLDMSEEQIQEWLYLRTAVDRSTTFEKFFNSGWYCFYYIVECTCGVIAVRNKPWIWNLDLCWEDYFDQTVNSDIWWFFMLCLSSAWSQLFSLMHDIKRKDFYINVVHHIVFVILLSLSWSFNLFRLITFIVLVSDVPEIFVEASKAVKYVGFEKTSIAIFITFAVMWIIVRLVLHPLWLMKSIVVDAPRIWPIFYTYYQYYMISGLAVVFFILNCSWCYYVVQAVIHIFDKGQLQDSRSDSDE